MRQETRQCYAILHRLIGIIHILILRSEAKPPKYRTHFNKSLDGDIFIDVKSKFRYTHTNKIRKIYKVMNFYINFSLCEDQNLTEFLSIKMAVVVLHQLASTCLNL